MAAGHGAAPARVAPVSAVVPCFRCAGTIERAVRSVAQQTLRPAELILVDDASPDDTGEVLERLRRELGADWIRVLHLPSNAGSATARNAGWEASAGEYVAFLDADDSWHPRKLEIQARFMREHPEFALSGHGHVFGGKFAALPAQVEHAEIGAGALLISNRFVTPSVMLRRALPQRFRAGQRHMEDHLLWMQVALGGGRIARLELALASLYKAQFGAGGQSGQLTDMAAAELGNYRLLRGEGRIGGAACAALLLWSRAKYLRRLALVALRGVTGT